MLAVNFAFVRANRNQNQLARMNPQEEGFNCQLSLWLPCWAICLKKSRRTFGEAATSIFLPAGFVDKRDFLVSACHLPVTVESADESA